MSLQQTFEYIQSNKAAFIRDFRTLLRQPSISAQGKGLDDCSRIVRKLMENAGIKTTIIPEKEGNPVVYGEIKSKNSPKTLLIYGHYDVQPPEPLEKWDSEPFGAEIHGKKIVARGAADSKNNVTSCIKAAESFLKSGNDIPLNLKFIFEGEEEIGSPHLPGFIKDNRERLKADSVVCYDGDFDEEDPVPWRKLSHRVRNEKVSQRAKLEGGVRTLSHRANMHDMRLQDWLSGSWI